MADDPGSSTPVKHTPQVGCLTPRTKKWQSLDFNGEGGTAKSLLGSRKQQVARKLVQNAVSPKRTRQKRGVSSIPVSNSQEPCKRPRQEWSREETTVLLRTIAAEYSEWPQVRGNHPFWQKAANIISKDPGVSGVARKASSVRAKVTPALMKAHSTLQDALEHYGIRPADVSEEQTLPETLTEEISKLNDNLKISLGVKLLESLSVADQIACLRAVMHSQNVHETEQIANTAFYDLACKKGIDSYPRDFSKLASDAMVRLQKNAKSNVLYKFAKCLADSRPHTDEPLMPITRMPFGLIEYQIDFFSCSGQLNMSADFRQFQQMMTVEFGERFVKLFRGPAWSGLKEHKDPYKARINVACVSYQTIQKDLRTSQFTTEPEVQVAALEQLKAANPSGRFWVKADATDIKSGIQESMKGAWNGDEDLLDGELQKKRQSYEDRRRQAKEPPSAEFKKAFEDDSEFLNSKLIETVKMYQKKNNMERTPKYILKELNWDIVELIDLLDKNADFQDTYWDLPSVSSEAHKALNADIMIYLRELYIKKRTAATHVMVFMISEERRAQKPYALPVLYVPYRGMTTENLRRLNNMVVKEMEKLGMEYAGLVTDGEFEALRRKGDDGTPIHLFQIIQDLRTSVNRLSETKLLQILTKCGGNDAKPVPDDVPDEVIDKIDTLVNEGNTLDEALTIVRSEAVPLGYTPAPWRVGAKSEDPEEKMRSIVLTYRFREEVRRLRVEEGRDFTQSVYVPEVNPTTNKNKHARGDHNHLLKRIATHTRDGGPKGVDARKFEYAVKSKNTGLNMSEVLGERKQSTHDAEKFLSHEVADFFQQEGYSNEYQYVKTVANWHEATDGRGMKPEQRKDANKAMLKMVMDDWVPWHEDNPDLSLVDVNVRLQGVCGFSAETVAEVTTTIVSQEMRREESTDIGYPEHPRASTTDDVECFFSLEHRITHGKHVTLSEFKYYWRRLILQFLFRMQRDLPFYVWTLNERFTLDDLPSFDDIPEEENYIPRLHSLARRRREDCSIVSGGKSVLPVKHSRSKRNTWHAHSVEVTDDVPNEFVQRLKELKNKEFVVT